MQLHYLLVVVVVNDISDVKVMSSTVAVILAITWVVTNYNIQSETWFLKQTKLIPNRIRVFFSKKRTEPNGNKNMYSAPPYHHQNHTQSWNNNLLIIICEKGFSHSPGSHVPAGGRQKILSEMLHKRRDETRQSHQAQTASSKSLTVCVVHSVYLTKLQLTRLPWPLIGSRILLEPCENWPWHWPMTLTCKLTRYFSPVYAATIQKPDGCNSFQVIMHTDT